MRTGMAIRGPQGAVGINWRGAYGSGTTYSYTDAVSYQGSSYFRKNFQNGTSGNPPTNTTYWDVIAAVGTAGPAGSTVLTPTKTADYTALPGETVICNPTANFTVTLPATPAANTIVGIRRIDTSTARIISVAPGSNTIEGNIGTWNIYQPGASVTLQFDGGTAWRIIGYSGGQIPASGTALYPPGGTVLFDMYKGTAQSISNSTNPSYGTVVTVDVQATPLWGTSGSNPNVFTAPLTGYYDFYGAVGYAVNGTGSRWAILGYNATGYLPHAYTQLVAQGTSYPTHVQIQTQVYLNAGDRVSLNAMQNTSAALNTYYVSTLLYTPRLVVKWLNP